MSRVLSLVFLASPLVATAAPPVTAVAYSPKGEYVAFGAADEVRLFDADGAPVGKPIPVEGRVTALAFDPRGRWLAVAHGTAGKSGRVSFHPLDKPSANAGMDAHKDAIYALAFSPDGKTLATAGYDRVIHLWDVPQDGKLAKAPRLTLKDHSDAVYGLSFHPDGKLLASAGADRAVKVWDVASGKRLYTLGDATDWVYAVAWSPDKKHLAAAGVDKSLRVWSADADGGKLVTTAFAHAKPVWRIAYSGDGKTLYSVGEDKIVKAWDAIKLTEAKVYAAQPDTILGFALRPDGKQFALARFDGAGVLIDTASGKVVHQPLPVKAKAPPVKAQPPKPDKFGPAGDAHFETVQETGITDSARTAMAVKLNSTVVGAIDRAGDVDYFRFVAKVGDQVGVQVIAAELGSKLAPALVLTDARGTVLAEGDATLGYVVRTAGTYAVGIRDRDYRGGSDFKYRLHIGNVPVVTGVFPLAVPRGRTSSVHVTGVNLGAPGGITAKVTVPKDAVPGAKVAVPLGAVPAVGSAAVVVSEFPSVVLDPGTGADLRVPGAADGIFTKPNETQTARFSAKKGERLVVEVLASRAVSPVDSVIEILDAAGKPVPRGVLRATAKTSVTFRDHDSRSPGIRLDAWNELSIDDYLYVNGEVMRILALPKGPDDDTQFYQLGGQRLAFFGTTPAHHSMGLAMYKVELHPPGATFPPNGLPLFPLHYRNDDGGPGYGKDSRLFFDPPADGTYQVRVRDARGAYGPTHAFHVTVRAPKPDFSVSFTPTAPAVWKGGAVPVTVTVNRLDGFAGAVRAELVGLPTGFTAPTTFIEAGQTATAFALHADADATVPPGTKLKLVARATIGGKDLIREGQGGLPKVVPPGDIVTTVRQQTIVLQPGKETRFTVDIVRQGKFAGRVPVEVKGLPHGVRVLNIGLNGILITERDTSREVVLYAEPWVKPTARPIVVFARREGKNTEHAAKSVLLKVER